MLYSHAAESWGRTAGTNDSSIRGDAWHASIHEPAAEFRKWLRRRKDLAIEGEVLRDGVMPTRRTAKMARLEAVLLVTDGVLSTRKLAQLATLVDAAEAGQLIDALNDAYDSADSAYRVERVASGYQLLTRPQFARWLDKLHHRQSQLKLSPPAMETLTIVAYRQPVTRADVELVRGVQCTEMLKQLMERNLVRIAGHDDSLGRPYLYGTTRNFLELFGLRNLKDLPLAERLQRKEPDAEIGAGEVEAESDEEVDDDLEIDDEEFDAADFEDEDESPEAA